MGVSTSTPQKEEKVIQRAAETAASEDKILFDKILQKSRDLFQHNKENFLDEKFYPYDMGYRNFN